MQGRRYRKVSGGDRECVGIFEEGGEMREVRLPEPVIGCVGTRKSRLGVGECGAVGVVFHVTEFQRCPSISVNYVVAAHLLS